MFQIFYAPIFKNEHFLFERQFENHEVKKCLNKVHEGCEWVLNGEGYPTEKLDGTCCMIKDNQLYRRYDYKEGRTLPINVPRANERLIIIHQQSISNGKKLSKTKKMWMFSL